MKPALFHVNRRLPSHVPLSTLLTRLEAVHDTIVRCERCPRLRAYCQQVARDKRRAYLNDTYWGRPVPGFGDPSARLLIVGLAPAAHGANRTGRVFTGDGTGGSGDFLMDALHRTGFANIATSRHVDDGLVLYDAYIVAAVRCAPPANAPRPEEITRCLDHLEAEIGELRRVQVVVALGKLAFDAWLRVLRRSGIQIPSPRPRFAHGRLVRITANDGQPELMLGCYHPSRQNTNTGKLTPAMMASVFRKAKGMLQ
jgi:uracil-DNA glycosylase family 4